MPRERIGDDKTCGTLFTGKNTSNLVAYIQRSPKEEHASYVQREKNKKCSKQGMKRPAQLLVEDVIE